VRCIVINDPHLADRPPSIRTETYAEDIFAKLDWVADYAVSNRVHHIVFSGDLFHVKTPSRTSHALVQRMCDYVNQAEFQTYIVPGNHDLSHDRIDSLDRQPLGVLFKAGAELLDGESLVFGPGGGLFGIPWLQDWERDLPDYMERWQKSQAQLMVTHAPIAAPGLSPPWEHITAQGWATAMVRPGYVAQGHIHDPDGVYAVGEVTFANEGALSRGSIHESTLTRKPAVTLWDSSTGFERIEVPHKPAAEVFKLASHYVEEARAERLDEFLDQIGSTVLERVHVEKILADLKDRGIEGAVLREVEECLEQVT
jgi:DNA repair exonuclease SbcCD nuclease subunit